MVDVVSPEVRSRMMAGIRGKDTKPEITIRKGLHRKGFRFRLHDNALPGRPDIVLPRYKAVIFTHGCFWHGHTCSLFKWPKTRIGFWRKKLSGNRARDLKSLKALRGDGWRIAVVWECALKGRGRRPEQEVVDRCVEWLRSNRNSLVLAGRERRMPSYNKSKPPS